MDVQAYINVDKRRGRLDNTIFSTRKRFPVLGGHEISHRRGCKVFRIQIQKNQHMSVDRTKMCELIRESSHTKGN